MNRPKFGSVIRISNCCERDVDIPREAVQNLKISGVGENELGKAWPLELVLSRTSAATYAIGGPGPEAHVRRVLGVTDKVADWCSFVSLFTLSPLDHNRSFGRYLGWAAMPLEF